MELISIVARDQNDPFFGIFVERNKYVSTPITADDPLIDRFQDDRPPIEQYKAGEQFIKMDNHQLYSHSAYTWMLERIGQDPRFPRLNFETSELFRKMVAQENERKSALEACIDFDHLPCMPWIGSFTEEQSSN